MDHGEFFRLDVNSEFLHFWVIGYVVQGNIEDLVHWDKCHEVVQVVPEVAGFCIRDITFLQLSLFNTFWDYDCCSKLTAADTTGILCREYYFKDHPLLSLQHFLFWYVSGAIMIFRIYGHIFHIV